MDIVFLRYLWKDSVEYNEFIEECKERINRFSIEFSGKKNMIMIIPKKLLII